MDIAGSLPPLPFTLRMLELYMLIPLKTEKQTAAIVCGSTGIVSATVMKHHY
jgi:hypothetical protein